MSLLRFLSAELRVVSSATRKESREGERLSRTCHCNLISPLAFGYMIWCACRRLHVFPRLPLVHVFLRLPSVTRFPALAVGYMSVQRLPSVTCFPWLAIDKRLSRACHASGNIFHVPTLASCLISQHFLRASYRFLPIFFRLSLICLWRVSSTDRGKHRNGLCDY